MKLSDFIFILIAVICAFLVFYLLFVIYTKEPECVLNPTKYVEKNYPECSCYCVTYDGLQPQYTPPRRVDNPPRKLEYWPLNYS